MDPKDFGKAYELFRKRMYYKDKHGEISISCKISAALNSPETHHNCIGCNLLVSLDTIERVLRRLSEAKELESEADYPAFILPLYLFVERAHMVFGMIELPKSYEAKYFGVFTTIKRWANFLKHPNYFILAHHPKFEVGTKPSKKSKTLVNTDFVRTHYKSDENNNKLKGEFFKNKDVIVLYPHPLELVENFCRTVERRTIGRSPFTRCLRILRRARTWRA